MGGFGHTEFQLPMHEAPEPELVLRVFSYPAEPGPDNPLGQVVFEGQVPEGLSGYLQVRHSVQMIALQAGKEWHEEGDWYQAVIVGRICGGGCVGELCLWESVRMPPGDAEGILGMSSESIYMLATEKYTDNNKEDNS